MTFSLLWTALVRSSMIGARLSVKPSECVVLVPVLLPMVLPTPVLVPFCLVVAQLRPWLSPLLMVVPLLSLSLSPSVTTFETAWLSVSATPSVCISVSLCEEPLDSDQLSCSDQLAASLSPPLRPFDKLDDCVRSGQSVDVGSVVLVVEMPCPRSCAHLLASLWLPPDPLLPPQLS